MQPAVDFDKVLNLNVPASSNDNIPYLISFGIACELEVVDPANFIVNYSVLCNVITATRETTS